MAKFWKRHWFDAAMVAVWLLYYFFVVEDKNSFLLLCFLIFGRNFAAWARKGKLR